jgi:hypothetical protein
MAKEEVAKVGLLASQLDSSTVGRQRSDLVSGVRDR